MGRPPKIAKAASNKASVITNYFNTKQRHGRPRKKANTINDLNIIEVATALKKNTKIGSKKNTENTENTEIGSKEMDENKRKSMNSLPTKKMKQTNWSEDPRMRTG